MAASMPEPSRYQRVQLGNRPSNIHAPAQMPKKRAGSTLRNANAMTIATNGGASDNQPSD